MSQPDRIELVTGSTKIEGILTVPPAAAGLVVFAQPGGSQSAEDRRLTARFNERGLATFTGDLLPYGHAVHQYNPEYLAGLLASLTESLAADPRCSQLNVGYLGFGMGATAALGAAARFKKIKAVVACEGQPELLMPLLPGIRAAVMLLTSSHDFNRVDITRRSYHMLSTNRQFTVIGSSGPLDSEPALTAEIGDHALEWFERYLAVKLAQKA